MAKERTYEMGGYNEKSRDAIQGKPKQSSLPNYGEKYVKVETR
jgi:hypothetical protein